ncbi:hypothetical protein SPHINGOT1_340009 [Sphingomonas sp. T1]|nr:hypothetical protein SPHINGOT1_340009 [Sphingomonas sp. T1]
MGAVAPVSRSSPEWAETGYGLGGAKRNRATVPVMPGDAPKVSAASHHNARYRSIEGLESRDQGGKPLRWITGSAPDLCLTARSQIAMQSLLRSREW